MEVLRRVVAGTEAEVISRLIGTQRSIRALINTAYIERLQATLRARLSDSVGAQDPRRSAQTVHAGKWDVAGGWLL